MVKHKCTKTGLPKSLNGPAEVSDMGAVFMTMVAFTIKQKRTKAKSVKKILNTG